MRVLVTGGAGYIGSHTAKALAKSGYEPVTLDNLTTGNASAVKWGPLVEGDISDQSLVRNLIATYKIQAVVHFAANAYVGESVLNPRNYYLNNVANSLSLLEAVLDSGIRHFVFSSSCTVYGVPTETPTSEDAPLNPISPYGESKLFIERALRAYDNAYDLSSVSLRYFNASGADPDGEIGEQHDPETHLIPLVVQSVTNKGSSFDIFGTDYPTPDGTAIRDYVHVSDLASAHVLALRYLVNGGQSGALNLSTNRGYSVREIVHAVETASGRRVPVRERPRRPGDPPMLIGDARLARETLGWDPEQSELNSIVSSALNWFASDASHS